MTTNAHALEWYTERLQTPTSRVTTHGRDPQNRTSDSKSRSTCNSFAACQQNVELSAIEKRLQYLVFHCLLCYIDPSSDHVGFMLFLVGIARLNDQDLTTVATAATTEHGYGHPLQASTTRHGHAHRRVQFSPSNNGE